MPIRRVPTSFPDFEDQIEEIEKTQRIIGICPSGDGAALVLVEPKRSGRETRGAK